MCLRLDNKKLLEKYETIWTRSLELKNYEFNSLPVYDDR